MILLPLLAVASGCMLFGTDDDDTVVVKPVEVGKPDWARSGIHSRYTEERGYFFVAITGGKELPREVVLRRALYERLHREVDDALKDLLPSPLAQACKDGMWVTRLHIPDADLIVGKPWTDGFESAAFLAISREDLVAHNAARLEKGLRFLGKPHPTTPTNESAVDDLAWRVEQVARATDDLTSLALAGIPPEGKAVEDARRIAEKALAFYDELVAKMSGGGLRINLGEKPRQAIELKLIYRGAPAIGLPLRALTGGLTLGTSRQTDESGLAKISFPEPMAYTGQAAGKVGFALDANPLAPGVTVGLSFRPWTTTLTLPAFDNTLVYIKLIEKASGDTITGPVSLAIRRLLEDAGMPVLDQAPTDKELRDHFVLSIEGVLSCYELEKQGTARRQLRAKGSIILRTYNGPALANVALEAVIDIDRDDLIGAARKALAEGWKRIRKHAVRNMREAFPPLFNPME